MTSNSSPDFIRNVVEALRNIPNKKALLSTSEEPISDKTKYTPSTSSTTPEQNYLPGTPPELENQPLKGIKDPSPPGTPPLQETKQKYKKLLDNFKQVKQEK